MNQLTQGPWHVGGIFEPDSTRPTANVWGSTMPGMSSGNIVCCNATVADARLIAAAPDLADALMKCITAMCSGHSEEEAAKNEYYWQPVIKTIRAALAKAGL